MSKRIKKIAKEMVHSWSEDLPPADMANEIERALCEERARTIKECAEIVEASDHAEGICTLLETERK